MMVPPMAVNLNNRRARYDYELLDRFAILAAVVIVAGFGRLSNVSPGKR